MPKARYIWMAAIVLALAMLAVALKIDDGATHSALELHRRYQTQTLNRVGWQILSSLDRAVGDQAALSGLTEVRQLQIPQARAHLVQHFHAARASGLRRILLFDSEGRLLLDLPGRSGAGAADPISAMTQRDRIWADQASKAGRARLQIRREAVEGLTLELVTPIYEALGEDSSDGSTRIQGTLVSATSLDPLVLRLLESLRLTPSTHALLMQDGRVLAAYPKDSIDEIDAEGVFSDWMSRHPDVAALTSSPYGFGRKEWSLGAAREDAVVFWWPLRVGEQKLLLVTATPEKELLPGSGGPLRGHTLSSVVMVMVLFGFTAFLVRSQRSRLKLIREVAREQELSRKIGEQAWQSALLSDIVGQIRSVMDVTSVGMTAVQTIGRALGVSRCILYSQDGPSSYRVQAQFVADEIDPVDVELELPEKMIREGLSSPILLDPIENEPVQFLSRVPGLTSLVLAPVPRASGRHGLMALHQCRVSRDWSQSELQFIERFAAQVGTALDQAELYAVQVRAAAGRAGVLGLAHALSTTRETRSVMDQAVRLAVRLTRCRRGILLVRQPSSEQWAIGADHEFSTGGVIDSWLDAGRHLHPYLEEAVIRKQPVIIESAERDVRVPRDHFRTLGLESVLALPLPDGDRVAGLLVLERRTSEGPPDGLETSIARDIAQHTASALRNAALIEALQASQARYHDLYDHAPDMYQTLDSRGILLDCNDTQCQLLGFGKKEIVGGPFSDLLTPDAVETWREVLPRIFEEGFVKDVCLRLSTKDGRPVEVLLNASVIRESEGTAKAARAVLRDVTHLKELEQQLRQSQKMEIVGTLAGGVAHDFNNLLGGILGYASLLRGELEELGGPTRFAQAIKHLETIERSATRGSELTSKLLTAGRHTASRSQPVDVNCIVEETTELLSRTVNKNIRIEKHLGDGLKSILGDSSQIQQVALNLCVNARDAMPSGGLLLVETEYVTDGERVRLSVQDTGIGMDSYTLEHIFEPFFSTKGTSGTGLGLAVVYGIVQSHGGQVHVESTPGKGTRFDIFFPAHHTPAQADEQPHLEPVRGGGERILLVDDEEMLRHLGRDILTRFGYQVELAGSGEEALHIVRQRRHEIGLVILDLVMPGLDGTETCRRMKSVAPELPVLISSGLSRDGAAQSALKEGAVGFLAKPFAAAELTQAVSAGLQRRPTFSSSD